MGSRSCPWAGGKRAHTSVCSTVRCARALAALGGSSQRVLEASKNRVLSGGPSLGPGRLASTTPSEAERGVVAGDCRVLWIGLLGVIDSSSGSQAPSSRGKEVLCFASPPRDGFAVFLESRRPPIADTLLLRRGPECLEGFLCVDLVRQDPGAAKRRRGGSVRPGHAPPRSCP